MCDLDVPVVGAVSDAQYTIASLWPNVPLQVCQFHYLREATCSMFDVDRNVREQIRKAMQQGVRPVWRQIGT